MSRLPLDGTETTPSTVLVSAACSLGFIYLLATAVLLSRSLSSLVIYFCCLFYRGVEGDDDFMQCEINCTIILHAAHQILLVLLKSAIVHVFKTCVIFFVSECWRVTMFPFLHMPSWLYCTVGSMDKLLSMLIIELFIT